MAFVVPAEIGHAPYAAPLLEYLVGRFSIVHIVAVRENGFGGRGADIRFTNLERFTRTRRPPRQFLPISVQDWRTAWNRRLRPFLMSSDARDLYREVVARADSRRFGELASIGIGYVSGANDFFHLRPSDVEQWEIPGGFMHPSVRNGRALPPARLTAAVVERWKRNDDQMLLLRLPKTGDLPRSVRRYLETDAARVARTAYKCRVRDPWYSVPDVQIPLAQSVSAGPIRAWPPIPFPARIAQTWARRDPGGGAVNRLLTVPMACCAPSPRSRGSPRQPPGREDPSG
jgi:adenine-specific DNA-methyltransferase